MTGRVFSVRERVCKNIKRKEGHLASVHVIQGKEVTVCSFYSRVLAPWQAVAALFYSMYLLYVCFRKNIYRNQDGGQSCLFMSLWESIFPVSAIALYIFTTCDCEVSLKVGAQFMLVMKEGRLVRKCASFHVSVGKFIYYIICILYANLYKLRGHSFQLVLLLYTFTACDCVVSWW